MHPYYLLIFIATLALSALITPLIGRLARRFGVIDYPDAERKLHKKPLPLLGGLAVFVAFFAFVFILLGPLTSGNLDNGHWLGFFIGGCFLMLGGWLDDRYRLKPGLQFIFPVMAAISVIAGGVEIEKITNPLGHFLFLDSLRIPIMAIGGQVLYFVVVSDLLIILWLLGMMYTTKLLDGVDGLVTGVTAIGALIIFLFTMTTRYHQPDIGLAALILAGACLGFLIWNFYPAKIFLGEGGSLFLGYALGVLAIISGGKIAIALLVMGIPIMDVAWTIIRRLKAGRNPFKFADRKHLHFRLLDLGLSSRRTALVYYLFAAVFGLSALFFQSLGKFVALLILLLAMFAMVVGFGYLEKRRSRERR